MYGFINKIRLFHFEKIQPVILSAKVCVGSRFIMKKEMFVDANESVFTKEYTEDGLWGKIKNFAKVAGIEVIEKVLQLYYALQSPETPIWAKSVIIGALGYFISPLDAIPDIVPVFGYSDDLGVLAAAVTTVATYITDDIKAKAKAKLAEWF